MKLGPRPWQAWVLDYQTFTASSEGSVISHKSPTLRAWKARLYVAWLCFVAAHMLHPVIQSRASRRFISSGHGDSSPANADDSVLVQGCDAALQSPLSLPLGGWRRQTLQRTEREGRRPAGCWRAADVAPRLVEVKNLLLLEARFRRSRCEVVRDDNTVLGLDGGPPSAVLCDR